ncbi:MAG: DUF1343 domain-containing protein [Planctomycetes bacterium]|nr:DUF1343 domain-containing protein [Planctomycetota bacterium]
MNISPPSQRRFTDSAILLLATCAVSVVAAPEPSQRTQSDPSVKLGIDVLIDDGFKPLLGQRVGLITNPTGVTGDLRSTIDVLHEADGVKLVALFGPEHGVRGEAHAGAHVADARDAITGLPIRSLYGKHRKPTPEMLADLDVLVFDIQDIGSRSYTYISTMAVAMEGAAENGKRFIVLDRPNPITGNKIECRPLDMQYQSFVGYMPIPYVHGLTVGELARMINGEGWLEAGVKCDLQVVPMKGWRRDMWFDQTGLTWVPTSPHVPRAETSLYYAATGIMGELRVISEGVGYTLPFELAGAPDIHPQKLADELNNRSLPGVFFRPTYFQPYYGPYAKKTCGGVHILFTDRDRAELTPIQFHVMHAVRQLYPETSLFDNKRDAMFDKVCGTDRVRRMFLDGRPIEAIIAFWGEGVEEFRARRGTYLLYD